MVALVVSMENDNEFVENIKRGYWVDKYTKRILEDQK